MVAHFGETKDGPSTFHGTHKRPLMYSVISSIPILNSMVARSEPLCMYLCKYFKEFIDAHTSTLMCVL